MRSPIYVVQRSPRTELSGIGREGPYRDRTGPAKLHLNERELLVRARSKNAYTLVRLPRRALHPPIREFRLARPEKWMPAGPE